MYILLSRGQGKDRHAARSLGRRRRRLHRRLLVFRSCQVNHFAGRRRWRRRRGCCRGQAKWHRAHRLGPGLGLRRRPGLRRRLGLRRRPRHNRPRLCNRPRRRSRFHHCGCRCGSSRRRLPLRLRLHLRLGRLAPPHVRRQLAALRLLAVRPVERQLLPAVVHLGHARVVRPSPFPSELHAAQVANRPRLRLRSRLGCSSRGARTPGLRGTCRFSVGQSHLLPDAFCSVAPQPCQTIARRRKGVGGGLVLGLQAGRERASAQRTVRAADPALRRPAPGLPRRLCLCRLGL